MGLVFSMITICSAWTACFMEPSNSVAFAELRYLVAHGLNDSSAIVTGVALLPGPLRDFPIRCQLWLGLRLDAHTNPWDSQQLQRL